MAVQSNFRAGQIDGIVKTKHGKIVLPVVELGEGVTFEFIEYPGREFCSGMMGERISTAETRVDRGYL